MTAALYVDEKRSLTLTLSKGRGDSGIAECSQLSHTEPLGRWPVGEKQGTESTEFCKLLRSYSLPDELD